MSNPRRPWTGGHRDPLKIDSVLMSPNCWRTQEMDIVDAAFLGMMSWMIGRMLLFFIGDDDLRYYLPSACADLLIYYFIKVCRGREIHEKSILTFEKKATDSVFNSKLLAYPCAWLSILKLCGVYIALLWSCHVHWSVFDYFTDLIMEYHALLPNRN